MSVFGQRQTKQIAEESSVYVEEQLRDSLLAVSTLSDDNAAPSLLYAIRRLIPWDESITIREAGSWRTDPAAKRWGATSKAKALDEAGKKPREYTTASYSNDRLTTMISSTWRESKEQKVDALVTILLAYARGKSKSIGFTRCHIIDTCVFDAVGADISTPVSIKKTKELLAIVLAPLIT